MARALAHAPLSARARADIERIEEGSVDYLPGVPSADKKLQLSRISYRDFLRDLVKADPKALAYYQPRSHDEWAVGIDAVSRWTAGLSACPDFAGCTGGRLDRAHGYTPSGYKDTGGSASLHFPDGNATIARLLVRSLLPEAVPGSNAEDVVTARVDYRLLDRPDSSVRCDSAVSCSVRTMWRSIQRARGAGALRACGRVQTVRAPAACSPATTQ